jgi:hypothetical protein
MSTKRKSPASKAKKPAAKKNTAAPATAAKDVAREPKTRDPRLPKPGTVVQRVWHGKTYVVTVNESDFTFKEKAYRSLSGLAREITGAKSINGVAWFGLGERPAPKTKDAKKAKAPVARSATEASATTTGEAK